MITEGKVYISRFHSEDIKFIPDVINFKVLKCKAGAVVYVENYIVSNFLYMLTESEYIEYCLIYGEAPIKLSTFKTFRFTICNVSGVELYRRLSGITYYNYDQLMIALSDEGCYFEKMYKK